VCKLLAARGFNPITFDNLSRGHRAAVRWGPLRIGDLKNKSEILSALKDFQIDNVLHFAGLAYVEESVADPGRYFQNNIAGSLKLFEAMVEMQIRNLVFSSTCAVYGNHEARPISKDAPTGPIKSLR